jgi:hypothetical protein
MTETPKLVTAFNRLGDVALECRFDPVKTYSIMPAVFNLVVQITFFLVAKCFAVADEKLKIARVRLIHMWIINFVHDAVTQREPQAAARVISRAETLFGAGGPAWFDSGRAECNGVSRQIHF